MRKDIERARMLMGVWASAPERTRALMDERHWAQSLQAATESAEGSDTWDKLIGEIDAELARYAAIRLAVNEALGEMDEMHRAVMVMRYQDGESYPAIARRLGYSVDRVKHIKTEADVVVAGKVSYKQTN